MITISNIAEAQEAAKAVAEFLAKFNGMIGLAGHAAGNSSATGALTPTNPLLPGLSPLQSKVIQILKDAGRPLKADALVDDYTRRGWVVANPDKIKTVLYSCAHYLVKKNYLSKTKAGFAFVSQHPELEKYMK